MFSMMGNSRAPAHRRRFSAYRCDAIYASHLVGLVIGIPQVESVLEIQPHLRVCVCKPAQPQSHVGAYPALPSNDLVYGSTVDFEPFGQHLLGQAKLYQDVFPDEFPWMYRSLLREHPESPFIDDSPHKEHPQPYLTSRLLLIARECGLKSTRDAHYLALAQELDTDLWTADRRLVNTVTERFPLIKFPGDQ
jgi:hypothetical protein